MIMNRRDQSNSLTTSPCECYKTKFDLQKYAKKSRRRRVGIANLERNKSRKASHSDLYFRNKNV